MISQNYHKNLIDMKANEMKKIAQEYETQTYLKIEDELNFDPKSKFVSRFGEELDKDQPETWLQQLQFEKAVSLNNLRTQKTIKQSKEDSHMADELEAMITKLEDSRMKEKHLEYRTIIVLTVGKVNEQMLWKYNQLYLDFMNMLKSHPRKQELAMLIKVYLVQAAEMMGKPELKDISAKPFVTLPQWKQIRLFWKIVLMAKVGEAKTALPAPYRLQCKLNVESHNVLVLTEMEWLAHCLSLAPKMDVIPKAGPSNSGTPGIWMDDKDKAAWHFLKIKEWMAANVTSPVAGANMILYSFDEQKDWTEWEVGYWSGGSTWSTLGKVGPRWPQLVTWMAAQVQQWMPSRSTNVNLEAIERNNFHNKLDARGNWLLEGVLAAATKMAPTVATLTERSLVLIVLGYEFEMTFDESSFWSDALGVVEEILSTALTWLDASIFGFSLFGIGGSLVQDSDSIGYTVSAFGINLARIELRSGSGLPGGAWGYMEYFEYLLEIYSDMAKENFAVLGHLKDGLLERSNREWWQKVIKPTMTMLPLERIDKWDVAMVTKRVRSFTKNRFPYVSPVSRFAIIGHTGLVFPNFTRVWGSEEDGFRLNAQITTTGDNASTNNKSSRFSIYVDCSMKPNKVVEFGNILKEAMKLTHMKVNSTTLKSEDAGFALKGGDELRKTWLRWAAMKLNDGQERGRTCHILPAMKLVAAIELGSNLQASDYVWERRSDQMYFTNPRETARIQGRGEQWYNIMYGWDLVRAEGAVITIAGRTYGIPIHYCSLTWLIRWGSQAVPGYPQGVLAREQDFIFCKREHLSNRYFMAQLLVAHLAAPLYSPFYTDAVCESKVWQWQPLEHVFFDVATNNVRVLVDRMSRVKMQGTLNPILVVIDVEEAPSTDNNTPWRVQAQWDSWGQVLGANLFHITNNQIGVDIWTPLLSLILSDPTAFARTIPDFCSWMGITVAEWHQAELLLAQNSWVLNKNASIRPFDLDGAKRTNAAANYDLGAAKRCFQDNLVNHWQNVTTGAQDVYLSGMNWGAASRVQVPKYDNALQSFIVMGWTNPVDYDRRSWDVVVEEWANKHLNIVHNSLLLKAITLSHMTDALTDANLYNELRLSEDFINNAANIDVQALGMDHTIHRQTLAEAIQTVIPTVMASLISRAGEYLDSPSIDKTLDAASQSFLKMANTVNGWYDFTMTFGMAMPQMQCVFLGGIDPTLKYIDVEGQKPELRWREGALMLLDEESAWRVENLPMLAQPVDYGLKRARFSYESWMKKNNWFAWIGNSWRENQTAKWRAVVGSAPWSFMDCLGAMDSLTDEVLEQNVGYVPLDHEALNCYRIPTTMVLNASHTLWTVNEQEIQRRADFWDHVVWFVGATQGPMMSRPFLMLKGPLGANLMFRKPAKDDEGKEKPGEYAEIKLSKSLAEAGEADKI